MDGAPAGQVQQERPEPSDASPRILSASPVDVIEFATGARNSRRVQQKRKIEDAIVQAITTRPDDFGLAETSKDSLSGFEMLCGGFCPRVVQISCCERSYSTARMLYVFPVLQWTIDELNSICISQYRTICTH